MSRLGKALLAVSALVFLSTSTFVCQRVAERGRFASAYSSYGSGPKGARALYLLSERLGAAPRRWSQDLAALPAKAMLVALGDCESGMARPLSRYEQEELVRWVERGGVLLVAGVRHYLPKELGVTFETESRCDPEWRFLKQDPDEDEAGEEDAPAGEADEVTPVPLDPEPADETEVANFTPPDAGADAAAAEPARASSDEAEAVVEEADEEENEEEGEGDDLDSENDDELAWTSPVGAPLLGLDPVPMRRPGRFNLDDDADYRAILTMPDALNMRESPVQREVGVIVRRGRGSVIALASGSMLQNRALSAAEGGVLFARLLHAHAPAGPVLFDEYHLGVGERRSMMRYLRQAGATPFIVQLMFVALLLLWRGGARFGGVQQPAEAAPAGTASFVAALGGLFARSGDPGGAAQVLVKQALGRVAAYHHLPPSSARGIALELSARGLTAAAAAVREISDAGVRAAREPGGGLAKLSRELDKAVARACA